MAVAPASSSGGDVPRHGLRYSLRTLFLVVLGCSVLFAIAFRVLLPTVEAARDSAHRSDCTNNLKQIGIGLHSYEQVYDVFPAAYLVDESGEPKHSWRAVLAPYEWQYGMDSPAYDFREKWNSTNNLRFADFFPGPYVCPRNSKSARKPRTDYVMVVGPENFSSGKIGRNAADIGHSGSATIAVVEIADSDINWVEPRDVSVDAISFQVNDRSQRGISSHHAKGANVLMADGHVKYLADSTDRTVIEALLKVSASTTR